MDRNYYDKVCANLQVDGLCRKADREQQLTEENERLDQYNKELHIHEEENINLKQQIAELESVKCDNETLIIQNKNMKEFGISVVKRNGELIVELEGKIHDLTYHYSESDIVAKLQSELSEAKLDIVRNQNIILEMEQEAKEAKEKLGRVTVDNLEKVLKENKACEHRDDYGCRPCYYEMATALVTAINGKE